MTTNPEDTPFLSLEEHLWPLQHGFNLGRIKDPWIIRKVKALAVEETSALKHIQPVVYELFVFTDNDGHIHTVKDQYFNDYQSQIAKIDSLIEGVSSMRLTDNYIIHKHTDPAFNEWFRDCQKDKRYAVIVLLNELASLVNSANDFAAKMLFEEGEE